MFAKILKFCFIFIFILAFYHYNPYLGIVGFFIGWAIAKLITNALLIRTAKLLSQFNFEKSYQLAQFTSEWEQSQLSLEFESFSKTGLLLEKEPAQAKDAISSYFESRIPLISELAFIAYGIYYSFPELLQWIETKFLKIDNQLPGIYRLPYLLTLLECRKTEELIDSYLLLFNPMTYFNKDKPGSEIIGLLYLFAGAGDIEGTELLTQIISLKKDYEGNLYWLAIAHLNHDEKEKAKQLFEIAMKGKNYKIKLWSQQKLSTLQFYQPVSLTEQHQQLLIDLKTANTFTVSSLTATNQFGQSVKIFMWIVLVLISLCVLFLLSLCLIPWLLPHV